MSQIWIKATLFWMLAWCGTILDKKASKDHCYKTGWTVLYLNRGFLFQLENSLIFKYLISTMKHQNLHAKFNPKSQVTPLFSVVSFFNQNNTAWPLCLWCTDGSILAPRLTTVPANIGYVIIRQRINLAGKIVKFIVGIYYTFIQYQSWCPHQQNYQKWKPWVLTTVLSLVQ